MKTKLCIFDLDFTLFDELYYLRKVLIDNKLIFEKDINFLNYDFRINSKDIIYDVLRFLNIENTKNLNYFKSRFANLKIDLQPYRNATNLLTKIKFSNIRICILTNGNPNTQKNKIRNLKLNKYFDKIVYARNFKNEKPSPISFRYISNYYNTFGNNILYIGDSLQNDIIPAKKLGMKTIWIKHHRSKKNIFPNTHTLDQNQLFNILNYL